MKKLGYGLFFIFFLPVLAYAKSAWLLSIDGAIGPSAGAYITHEIEKAESAKVGLIILQLNTPGGLEKTTRDITQTILNSPIPIVTYVAPSGARAASAGTYILYASHIAAMAPGTNLGAATPIALMGDEKTSSKPSTSEQKATEDASAYLRSMAQLNHRNETWANEAVKKSTSLSADEALRLGVINFIAKDVNDLLKQINGYTVNVKNTSFKLNTEALTIETQTPDWRAQLLNVITDPNIAYILLLIGICGIFFEFTNPGFILPGVVGTISLLLALYALQMLPINFVGLALIIVGIAFMVAEAFVAAFGALGIGGIIAFFLGSLLLLDTASPEYKIALSVIITISLLTAAFFLLIINLALKARFRPIVTGHEQLLHSEGIVIKQNNQLFILVAGEPWQIKSDESLEAGQRVKVINRDGMTLIVRRIL